MDIELGLEGEDWQLCGFLGGSWRSAVGPELPEGRPRWVKAHVPGSIMDDLWRAGEVPSPYFERNSLLLEWVPARTWVYRRPLVTPDLGPHDTATLVFEGVDHRAGIYVDGRLAGEHEGGFCPFELDVTAALAPGGRHWLAVVVHPAPESEPQAGDTARARVHKSRMSYGWDFCPRMVHLGIWRGVTLHLGRRPFRPRPLVELSAGLDRARARVEGAERLALLGADGPVALADGPEVVLDNPTLWWPNGSGEQHLYVLRAERAGQVKEVPVGFRHLELVPNPGAPAGARPYTVRLNGRDLFLKGWNWVPLDALYGVPRPAKLAHLLSLAAGAGANCLRVWGGGLLETSEFYDLCDQLGLLVWQEFSLSSSLEGSVPSTDAGYLATMGAEAPVVIGERRHHPSLALWCGGNELARQLPGRDDLPLDESEPVLALLAEAVRRHDPGRPFLPTSPSGPRFLNRLDIIAEAPEDQHDVHGPWEHQGLAEHNVLYDAGTCLLHSEVGVEGMTNRRSLEELISPAHRWPADRTNPVYEHLGAWWDNAPLVQRCFGGRLVHIDQLRRASQHLQYDGLRYVVESRLRHRPRTSGVLPWQFNEPYPNAWCTSAVDYAGEAKPAYYGVRRAYRPFHVCAAFPIWAWAGHEMVTARIFAWPGPAIVQARVVGTDGHTICSRRLSSGPGDLEGNRQASMGDLVAATADLGTPIFLIDLLAQAPDGTEVANRYVLSATDDLSPLLDLALAQVEARWEGEAVRLAHTAGPAAIGLVLEDGRPPGSPGWAIFDDNVIDLLPGEERRVNVGWHGPSAGPPPVIVQGWNAETQLVR